MQDFQRPLIFEPLNITVLLFYYFHTDLDFTKCYSKYADGTGKDMPCVEMQSLQILKSIAS